MKIALPTINVDPSAKSPITGRWSDTRYGWTPGQEIRVTGEGHIHCNYRVLPRAALITLYNADYRTRNCDLADGADEHKTYTNTAHELAHSFSENYSDTGFTLLHPLEALDKETAQEIVNAIAPDEELSLKELKTWFESGEARNLLESSPLAPELRLKAEAIFPLMKQAIDTAWSYQNKALDIAEHEVTEARAGRGGRSFFDERERSYYEHTGRRMPAETESGTIAEIGSTIAKAVAGITGGSSHDSVSSLINMIHQERAANLEALRKVEDQLKQIQRRGQKRTEVRGRRSEVRKKKAERSGTNGELGAA
jgi:hypothetical protein